MILDALVAGLVATRFGRLVAGLFNKHRAERHRKREAPKRQRRRRMTGVTRPGTEGYQRSPDARSGVRD